MTAANVRAWQVLHKSANTERLMRCDDAAVTEIDARIRKLETGHAS
jgi:hypothetical protein